MPRIRSIKPNFFKSEDVSALPLRARLTWVGLWTQCDDHGRYKDSVRLIKSDVWPLDDVSLRDIEEDLSILEQQRRLVRYEVDGKRFLAVVNWHAHQAINRPAKARYPAPPVPLGSTDPEDDNHCTVCSVPGQGALTEPSVSPHGAETARNEETAAQGAHVQLSESSVSPHGGLTSGREGKGRDQGGDVRAPASSEPPPPKCARHTNDPNPPNCGGCADARRTLDAWNHDRAAGASLGQSERARERAETTRLAINACDLCDPAGRLSNNHLCSHDPKQPARASRGAAAARAALQRPVPSEEAS